MATSDLHGDDNEFTDNSELAGERGIDFGMAQ